MNKCKVSQRNKKQYNLDYLVVSIKYYFYFCGLKNKCNEDFIEVKRYFNKSSSGDF